jgi:SpoIIAA-like
MSSKRPVSIEIDQQFHVVKIEVDGYVDNDTYSEIITELAGAIQEDRGQWRLLHHIKHFAGFDVGVLLHNPLFNALNLSAFKRVAVVTNDRGLRGATMLLPMSTATALFLPLLVLSSVTLPTQVRTYPESKLSEAEAWVKGDDYVPTAKRGTYSRTAKKRA